jgi:hypothetical protein
MFFHDIKFMMISSQQFPPETDASARAIEAANKILYDALNRPASLKTLANQII